MGVVWLAGDELLHRDVAVKEILWPPQLDTAERETLRQRALREARTAARLNHPHIVGVYDVIEDDGRPWIVMQLVAYRSLSDAMRDDGPLPPGRAAQVGLRILAALRAAHEIGVLHRDVKPGNVLLGPEDQVVLTDFGTAIADGSPTLTTSGVLIGSPSYMAPERARGEAAGPAADLWSLGATLYAAVEGRPPFDRDGTLAVLTAVVSDEPDPPRRAGPLWPLIAGLLRKDPCARLSAAEAEPLLLGVAGDQSAAPGVSPQEPIPWLKPRPDARARELKEPDSPTLEVLPQRRHPPLRWLFAAIAVLAAVAAIAAVIGVVSEGTPRHRAASPAAPTASHARTARPTGAATSASGTSSPRPAPPSTRLGALPAGFIRYHDPTGFSIGVPVGWQVSHEGHLVYIRDPSSGRFLLIDQSNYPKPNPLADWRQQEANRISTYPGYRRIRLQAVRYAQAERAADWEFTYYQNGQLIHVLNRNILANADHAYALYWSTPASEWHASFRFFEDFAATFRPAGTHP